MEGKSKGLENSDRLLSSASTSAGTLLHPSNMAENANATDAAGLPSLDRPVPDPAPAREAQQGPPSQRSQRLSLPTNLQQTHPIGDSSLPRSSASQRYSLRDLPKHTQCDVRP